MDANDPKHKNNGNESILLLSVTSSCACDCVFCGLPQIKRHSFISPNLFSVAIKGHPIDLPWEEVNLTGGEPLMHKRSFALFESLASLRQHFVKLSVCTSGVPFRSTFEGLRILAQVVGHVTVYVSLDGTFETHNRIRRCRDGFEQTIQFLAHASALDVDLVVHCVVNRQNVDSLESLVLFCNEVGIPLVFGLANVADHYIDNRHKQSNFELVHADYETIREFFARHSITVDHDILSVIAGEKRRNPCRLLKEGVLLTSQGDVSICGTSKKTLLGRLDKNASERTWRRLLRQRERVTHAALEVCSKCTYTW